jgi:hypothetical protein
MQRDFRTDRAGKAQKITHILPFECFREAPPQQAKDPPLEMADL